MNCDECKKKKEVATISYPAHESSQARLERINKRWFIFSIIILVLFVLTNLAWIIYDKQFETVRIEQDVQQDADSGSNSFIGGDYNGISKSDNEDYIPRP